MVAARTGDLNTSEIALREAELAGASPGQVRMLRGQVALHRGEFAEAVQELKQAATLLPESVSAQSLLAMALVRFGSFDRAEPVMIKLRSMSPRTAEDYLFRGQLEAVSVRYPNSRRYSAIASRTSLSSSTTNKDRFVILLSIFCL